MGLLAMTFLLIHTFGCFQRYTPGNIDPNLIGLLLLQKTFVKCWF